MSFLIIALPQEHYIDQPLDFIMLVDGEVVEAGRALAAQLPTFKVKDRAHEVVALVPLRAISWHQVQLPPGINAQSPRLRAVLDGLLEDQLLDQPGDLHLTLAGEGKAGSPDGLQWVAACERRWMAMAVQGLEAAGCKLTRVLPEWGPPGAHRVHVTHQDQQLQLVLCSPASISMLALNRENLAWALPEGQGMSADIRLTADPEVLEMARQQLDREVEPWPRSERWAAAALPRWDLSRGLLMRKRVQRSSLEWLKAPRWKAARWATVGLVAINLVGFNALAWQQSVHLQSRREQMRQVLQQTFPQTRAVVDPPVQMQRELDRLRAATTQPALDDLPVMLSAVLPALPASRSPAALEYASGQLRLKGVGLSPEEVRQLAGGLKARGYTVTAQGADLLMRTGS